MSAWRERARLYWWVVASALLAVLVGTAGVVWVKKKRDCDGKAGGLRLVYAIEGISDDSAVGDQVVKVLRARLGDVASCLPLVRRSGREVIVFLPGGESERLFAAKRMILRQGLLEFREVDRGEALSRLDRSQLPVGVTVDEDRYGYDGSGHGWRLKATTVAQLEQAAKALPPGTIAPPLSTLIESHEPEGAELYVVHPAALTGEQVEDARVLSDEQTGRWNVGLTFTPAGGRAFAELTARIVQRRLAIVFDGRITSAPVVMEKIGGGKAVITLGAGARSQEEHLRDAQELVTLLLSGSLPARLTLESEGLVGPLR